MNDSWWRSGDDEPSDAAEETAAAGTQGESDEGRADEEARPATRPPHTDEKPALASDAELGDAASGADESLSPHDSASRIETIIDEAQQSAKHFIEEARRQSELIIQEAQQDAKEKRAEVVGRAREQVDSLTNTAENMLDGAEQLSSELSEVATRLRESSDRLGQHVQELLHGPLPEAEQPQSSRRRFGRH